MGAIAILGGMLLSTAVSIAITVVSVANQIQQAKKMKKAARDAAEARKGFEVVTAGDTQPIPIVYGRAKIGGTRVWHNVKSKHEIPEGYTSNANKVFDAGLEDKPATQFLFKFGNIEIPLNGVEGSSLDKPRDGSKNEFLYFQQVLCHGPINRVIDFVVDESRFSDDPSLAKAKGKASFRTELHYDGSDANKMVSYNFPERTNAKFPGLAYASTAIRLDRDEPQFSGQVPMVQYFIEGRKIRKVLRSGTAGQYTYSLSDREYSNNPAFCLLDYLLDSERFYNSKPLFDSGKSLEISKINLESFYNASLICDTTVLNNKPVYGNVWQAADLSVFNTSRNIPLYECNCIIDVKKPIRENIEAILATMGDARLVWSGGKYKLILQYPATNDLIQLATTITDDDLIDGQEIQLNWPSASDRLNYATVTFSNESENFKEDSVSWPPKASSTFYKGLGGKRYPVTSSGAGGLLDSYGVWSGQSQETLMSWKFRALVSGIHRVTLQIDNAGQLVMKDSSNSTVVTVSTNRAKDQKTADVNLIADQVYTIVISGVDTGGDKGAAATIVKDNFIYWTTKEPAYSDIEIVTQSDSIYKQMLEEDSGVELETSLFFEGCVDYYHALAKAEELVRTSRTAISVKFSYLVKNNFLEPGDIIKLDSSSLNIAGNLYVRVNEVSLKENSICEVSGTRFDYTQLAWNVEDTEYTVPKNLYGFEIPKPSNFVFISVEGFIVNSSGKLEWTPVDFDGFAGYVLYALTKDDFDADGNPLFREIGRTQNSFFNLPSIKADTAVFGIKAYSKANRYSEMVITSYEAHTLLTGNKPPVPTDFVAVSDTTKAKITLSWTKPALRPDGTNYDDHFTTLVYRALDVNSFSSAKFIGESTTNSFVDLDEAYINMYYWIRFVSTRSASGDLTAPINSQFKHLSGSVTGTEKPPAPYNLAVEEGSNYLRLTWINPVYSIAGGHLKSLIYAAERLPNAAVPTFEQSILVGESPVESFGFPTESLNEWYFWVREMSVARTVSESAAGPSSGKAKMNVPRMLAALKDQLEESELTEALRTRLGQIDRPGTGLVDQMEDVFLNIGSITSNGKYATIEGLAKTVAGPDGTTAQYTIKLDVNGNVAGFGLSNTTNAAGTATSEFTILADQFSIAEVSSTAPAWNQNTTYAKDYKVVVGTKEYTSLTNNNLNKSPATNPSWWKKSNAPFFHLTAPKEVNGRLLEAGTYMDSAFITRLTADQINTNDLTIRDASGGLILGAGNAVDWNKLGGAATNLSGLGYSGDLNATHGADWATNLLNKPTTLAALDQTAKNDLDGKTVTYYQNDAPPGTVNDLWFDTNDGNKLYRHSGSSWVVVQDAGIAAAALLAGNAQDTADSKVVTFYSTTTPTAEGIGDMWYNSNTKTLYRWSGSVWQDTATYGMAGYESSNAFTASNGWSLNKDGSFTTIGGGNVIAVTPNNALISFKKPNGDPAFAVDSSGAAVFGGSLLGATGTFSGVLAAGVINSSAFDSIRYEYYTANSFSISTPALKAGWTAMHLRVIIVGAGGGGGGGAAAGAPNRNPTSSGGGGGAGSKVIYTLTSGVVPGSQINIIVGGGGNGGAGSNFWTGSSVAGANGGNGGASSISLSSGAVYQAGGGSGGIAGSSSLADDFMYNNNGTGGGGGGSVGGSSGVGGWAISANGGSGGTSEYGTAGAGGSAGPGYASNGSSGSIGSGGGGGGADAANPDYGYAGNGGNGGPGYIVLEFFDPNTVVLNSRYSKLVEWLDTIGHGIVPGNAR